MNILVVTNQLVEERNGSFFCIENFYDILNRFAQLGELYLCAQKYENKKSNILEKNLDGLVAGQNIHFVKRSMIRIEKSTRAILEKCISGVDIVIGYLPSLNASVACSIAKRMNKKYMAYVVGCPWDALWNHGLFGKLLAPSAFFRLRHTLKKADYALYVTSSFLQNRYPCPGIVCGCSDVRIDDSDGSVLIKRLEKLESLSENDTLNIVTIANYSVMYKGQHFVIAALARLKKLGITKYRYYLIGGGNKDRLEKLAKKLDVSELVHFEGIVPHSQILKKLDEMHIYIQPSLQEGLPRSVVEAMSRGLLCICANTAAMPEMVEPDYIVKRKSVDEIVDVLKKISVDLLKLQAERNYLKSKCYEENVLNEKRNNFFELVKNDS